jgi:hypothetical protein
VEDKINYIEDDREAAPDRDDWKRDYAEVRDLPGVAGIHVALQRTMMGAGKIVRCERYGVIEDWMYPTFGQAEACFRAWNGFGDAPAGWVRHVPSYRRRVDGDPLREYVKR